MYCNSKDSTKGAIRVRKYALAPLMAFPTAPPISSIVRKMAVTAATSL